MLIRLRLIFFVMLVTWCQQAICLVPVDSQIYGDFTSTYSERLHDPINYIVRPKEGKEFKAHLHLLRALYSDAENLTDSCEHLDLDINYRNQWEKESAERSFIATLQYIGLDVTVRAIAKYANELMLSKDEYQHLVDNLTNNYCSKNLSVISIKELKKNLLIKFEKENLFTLPTLQGHPYVKSIMDFSTVEKSQHERELLVTTELFRAFCSYGMDTEDLRLLPPIIRNSLVAATVKRHLSGKNYFNNGESDKVVVKFSDDLVHVACDGFLCRRLPYDQFIQKVPHSVGSGDLENDFSRFYCKKLKRLDLRPSKKSQKIDSWIKETDMEREYLQVGQFMALLWGIPDLFVPYDRFNHSLTMLRGSIDHYYNDWFLKSLDSSSKDLEYEETPTFEIMDHQKYFNRRSPKFLVKLDFNMGEFDRSVAHLGKLDFKFDLQFERDYMGWFRREYGQLSPTDESRRNYLFKTMSERVLENLDKRAKQFSTPLWRSSLAKLISREIAEQLIEYEGDYFIKPDESKMIKIPLEIYIAPFALKYIHNQFRSLTYDPLGN